MGHKDIVSGDKIGKAKAARYIKSEKGTEAIEVAFEFEEPSTGQTEHLTREFWLSDAARKYSEEALFDTLGCNGNIKQRDANGAFLDPKFLDYGREVKLVVEREEYTDKNGEVKDWPKIKYVNSIGGSQYAGCAIEETGAGLSAFYATALQRGKKHVVSKKEKAPF